MDKIANTMHAVIARKLSPALQNFIVDIKMMHGLRNDGVVRIRYFYVSGNNQSFSYFVRICYNWNRSVRKGV